MTYKRHCRLTLSGTLGDGSDIFSFGVSLAQQSQAWLDDLVTPDFPSNAITDDWRDKSVAFFGRPATMIGTSAHLKRITVAQIGADGRYEHAPVEYGVTQDGGGNGTAYYPWQVSLACTLETDADLGRVKGRFFLPLPVCNSDDDTDLIPAAQTADIGGSVKTWLDGLADQPGIDIADWRVVVASQGRRNANGTVRLGPGNHDVQRVSIGRRLDVQRRRANKVSETRGPDVTLDQV